MKHRIVRETGPITLVGGGVVSTGDLDLARQLAPVFVAADGGLQPLVDGKMDVAAVIGDMDSVAPEVLRHIPQDRVHHIDDQVTTDFDKALRHIAAPLVLGVGFSGGRVDHQLAAFHTLVARADQPCVLLCPTEVVLLCPPRITLDLAPGDVVSLFPMGRVTGRSTGLEWPIDGLEFEPRRFIGTSNRALGRVHMEMDQPEMLLILPRAAIRQVVQAVSAHGPRSRWPAL